MSNAPTPRTADRRWRRASNGSAAMLLCISTVFLVMGWLAAFTAPGLEFILIGSAIAVATVLVNRRLWTAAIASVLVGVAWFLPYLIGAANHLLAGGRTPS